VVNHPPPHHPHLRFKPLQPSNPDAQPLSYSYVDTASCPVSKELSDLMHCAIFRS
jgi:hypothetical protein